MLGIHAGFCYGGCMKNFVLCLSVLVLSAGSAHAQRYESYQMNQRLAQLEQSVVMLQQQLARNSGPGNAGVGHISAEIGRIDEQFRQLQGQIEQLRYQVDQANKRLTVMQEDMDFRMQELSKGQPAQTMPTEPQASSEPFIPPQTIPDTSLETLDQGLSQELQSVVSPEESAPIARLERPQPGGAETARDIYNRAFGLLNQTEYTGAERTFNQFIKQFPNDPLIGNAWYWLGETHYVRRDYVKAADSFRQGFEVSPDGPKAGDNLLKLAMSLAALQRQNEACIVLRQVDKKYAANSADLKEKARQELNRMGCP